MNKKIINSISVVLVFLTIILFRNELFNLFQKSINALQGIVSGTPYEVEQPKVSETVNTFKKKEVSSPGPLTIFNSSENTESQPGQALTISGIISETNKERTSRNMPALKQNSKLNASALKKVDDLFAKQYFEHISPSGVGVSDLANSVSYEYIIIGENLALGNFKDSNAVVDAWMASPGHRANILRTNYQEIGVGVKQGMYKGQKVWIAVQHFGTPLTACPIVDKVLKEDIENGKLQLDPIETRIAVLKSEIDSGKYHGKEYNDRVDEYNKLVGEYNALATQIKEKIKTYNAQVEAFNTCAQME